MALAGGCFAVDKSVEASRNSSRIFAQQARQLSELDVALYETAMLFALSGDPAGSENLFQRSSNQRTVTQLERAYVNSSLERTFTGHERPVTSVAFSPDGGQVLTGSDDGTARLWALDPFLFQSPRERVRLACLKARESGADRFTVRDLVRYSLLESQPDSPGVFAPYWD